MKYGIRYLSLVLCLVILAGCLTGVSAAQEGIEATILFTHDLHSHFLPAVGLAIVPIHAIIIKKRGFPWTSGQGWLPCSPENPKGSVTICKKPRIPEHFI